MSRLLCILLAACLLVVVRAGHEAEAESSGSGDGAQHRESLFDLVNGQSIVECDQCLTDRYLHHEDGMSSYGCETLRRTRPHGDIGVEGGHGELDYQSQGGPRKQPSAEKATDMAAEKKKFCSRLGKLAPKSALMAKQRPAAVLLKHWGIKVCQSSIFCDYVQVCTCHIAAGVRVHAKFVICEVRPARLDGAPFVLAVLLATGNLHLFLNLGHSAVLYAAPFVTTDVVT